ncbi:MAG TPA: hypothetical protein VEJ63_10115 [Planctomycetota bacterium]|nr:hypothetical protein [Planctomycetota bacterium]
MNNKNLRPTPDASLATPEAIQFRIQQIEAALAKTTDAVDTRRLNARIAALKARLSAGAEKTAVSNPALLKSKKDLE